ncbi:glycosyltransferase [Flavihumibacter profundi]|uniref:glycosyltransferase n=1 Tax=Flavihumibacter profundi TaxID=2716883 RepID=UPI001CC394B1|nr:glycosyltransferase [Flavihumibacter profundi]MBZ5855768.1 glycosyltransferase [Flavihumibacter profundi]
MKKKNIFYVGYSGFPIGLAQVERQKQIARGLIHAGCPVTVICRKGIHTPDNGLAAKGEFENIPYIYTSGSSYRPNSFFQRNWEKLVGLIREASFIIGKRRNSQVDALLVTTLKFSDVIWYWIIGGLTRLPVIIDTVEFNSSMDIRKGIVKKIDEGLYDKYSPLLADRVIVISDFLLQMVRGRYPNKPLLKIPAIVDFTKFTGPLKGSDPYFLYCASANYLEIIAFVIKSYEVSNVAGAKLFLVCNGSEPQMNKLRELIRNSKSSANIVLFSALPYQDLVDLYRNSFALLIPLRNTQQDVARFPHKLGEYCAASRAIITTNFGEVKAYFKDGKNAYIANEYDVPSFAAKMSEAFENRQLTEEVSKQAFITGKESFDNVVLGKKIADFIFPECVN